MPTLPPVQIRVLGPLVIGDGATSLGSPKERAVVELLALRAPNAVSESTLIAALWDDASPPSAVKTLQTLVSRVRHAIPDLAIERVGGAYRLQIAPDAVDARRVE